MNKDEDSFLKKLISVFKIETKERVQKIYPNLVSLETGGSKEKLKTIEKIFLEIHSLKSAARAVNFTNLEKLCQNLEDVLSAWKTKKTIPTAQQVDILHKINTGIEHIVEADDKTIFEISQNDMDTLCGNSKSMPKAANLKSSREVPKEKNGEKGKREKQEQKSKKEQKKKKENIELQENSENKEPINEEPKTREVTHETDKMEETVRISSHKLDSLLVQAEEMLTTKLNFIERLSEINDLKNEANTVTKELEKISPERFLLRKITQKNSRTSDAITDAQEKILAFLLLNENQVKLSLLSNRLDHDLHVFGSGVDELLDDTKKLLMLPFSTLLNLFPRIVRDLARDLNKDVTFIIEGAEVEIDKRILEDMKDVLLHLIRNSIDHGIESKEERKKSGKPASGTIKMTIQQLAGDEISIELSDDGSGINIEDMKRSAVKQGLLTPEEAQSITEERALALMYHSGVSTSKILTDLSGRGIGMTIVLEKIEKISGKMSVSSKPQEGTSFKIQLPLTLATFKGVLIKVSEQLFIIPTENMEHVLRVKHNTISTVENREAIFYDGRTTSLVWMCDILGLPSTKVKKNNKNNYLTLLIIAFSEIKIAFVVDDILNEQEVLVKKLVKPLSRLPNISACAVLGSGKPVPILNGLDLLKSAHASTTFSHKAAVDSKELQKNKHILLVEDSITTRMLLKNVLELSGFTVTTAVDGLDGWGLLNDHEFSAVVSDVEMPRMNGFELTEKIRKDKSKEKLPVILVTARESQQDRERGIDVGANAYLHKSTFDSNHLLEIVQRLVI